MVVMRDATGILEGEEPLMTTLHRHPTTDLADVTVENEFGTFGPARKPSSGSASPSA